MNDTLEIIFLLAKIPSFAAGILTLKFLFDDIRHRACDQYIVNRTKLARKDIKRFTSIVVYLTAVAFFL